MDFTGERFIPNVIEEDDEIKSEHLQRYQSIKDLVKGKVVLDAACGEGYGSDILANQAQKIYGIDIDSESISHAEQKYIKPNLQFLTGSIDKLPFEDSFFDIIISFETIEHVEEYVQNLFLKEIKRVMKEDGILIISTPNKKIYTDERKYKNPFHVKEFYEEEFYGFLKPHFNSVEFFYQLKENVHVLSRKNGTILNNLDSDANIGDNGKYIIAICSDLTDQEYNINSVIIENGKYKKSINRIVTLQDEVESRNNHIAFQDKEILEKNSSINLIEKEKNEYKIQLNNMIEELEVVKKKEKNEYEIRFNNIIKELESVKKVEIDSLKNQIIQGEEQNENLREKERMLNNIFESDGWKILLKYYKWRDKILPSTGKSRLFVKLFKKIIVNRNFKLLNKENVKKFIYYTKNQNFSMLESRVDDYIERNTSDASELKLAITQIEQEYHQITFKRYPSPTVSIVIPVYNQWDYTYSCLKSILTNTDQVSYEIIIADDMSTDETTRISEYVENIKVVRDGENRGFLLNCNNATKYAEGKFILFLNNDTQVQEGWLDSLVELIESDSQIGMVGSKLVYPDGRLQEAGGIIWNDASGWNFGRLDDPAKSEYNYVKEVDYISGAAIMIKKELWEDIGGFDERYVPAYYEDTDLAFEVRKHGYKVMYQPKSVVVHFEGISHGTDESSNIKKYQGKNKNVFVKKWEIELQNFHLINGKDVFWARDRSRLSKTIVVVDHYVPHYDKDAGGRCTFQYLKLFRSLGFNVIFIGDNFYRHEPYTSELQALGIEVLYGNNYSKNIEQWFKENGEYLDYVYLNRPHIAIKYIDMARKHTQAKIIYFGLDLHYLRELRNYEVEKNEELLKSSKEWKKIEFDLFSKADVIHVVGSYEQNLLQQEFPNKIIRNLPLFMFNDEEIDIENKSFDSRENILFVGGFNHKPNYDGVLWFVNEIFPNILSAKPNIKFYIVGSNPPNDIMALNSKNIIVTGYVTEEKLMQYYSDCRIVVVPLRYGAGVKGKVVEATSHHVPIVTTPIGSEGLIDFEQYSLIAKDSEEFSRMVIDLYDDIEMWTNLSMKSKDYISKYFTTNAALEQIKLDIN
ncbi:glycosyltransferase [Psychrobacillus glaciei]|uniref:Glycosyltransferase n=1 Tax=Psychrobacillus glaciei TaxID=2283160 RepID=A0A5J6SXP9_9BACI|nr:glycosyltransferase [Psychrobacillus glaciei]QFG01088.1 glycosyltransferase [Psychrobacillus glaciei]